MPNWTLLDWLASTGILASATGAALRLLGVRRSVIMGFLKATWVYAWPVLVAVPCAAGILASIYQFGGIVTLGWLAAVVVLEKLRGKLSFRTRSISDYPPVPEPRKERSVDYVVIDDPIATDEYQKRWQGKTRGGSSVRNIRPFDNKVDPGGKSLQAEIVLRDGCEANLIWHADGHWLDSKRPHEYDLIPAEVDVEKVEAAFAGPERDFVPDAPQSLDLTKTYRTREGKAVRNLKVAKHYSVDYWTLVGEINLCTGNSDPWVGDCWWEADGRWGRSPRVEGDNNFDLVPAEEERETDARPEAPQVPASSPPVLAKHPVIHWNGVEIGKVVSWGVEPVYDSDGKQIATRYRVEAVADDMATVPDAERDAPRSQPLPRQRLDLSRPLRTRDGRKVLEIIDRTTPTNGEWAYPLSARIEGGEYITYTLDGRRYKGTEDVADLVYADEEKPAVPDNLPVQPKELDWSKPLVTRDGKHAEYTGKRTRSGEGRLVIIEYTDRPDHFVEYVYGDAGDWKRGVITEPHPLDLINVEEVPVTKPFDPSLPVRTRDGRPARIVSTKHNDSKFPILAVLTRPDGSEDSETYAADGHFSGPGDPDRDEDLVNYVPDIPPATPAEVFHEAAAVVRIKELTDCLKHFPALKVTQLKNYPPALFGFTWEPLKDDPNPEMPMEARDALRCVANLHHGIEQNGGRIEVIKQPSSPAGLAYDRVPPPQITYPEAAIATVAYIKEMLEQAGGKEVFLRAYPDPTARCSLGIRRITSPLPEASLDKQTQDAVRSVGFIKEMLAAGFTVLSVKEDKVCWSGINLQAQTPREYAKLNDLVPKPSKEESVKIQEALRIVNNLRECVNRDGSLILVPSANVPGFAYRRPEQPKPTAVPFDPTKPCRTRDGRKVRILCTDKKGDYPIVAIVTEDADNEGMFGFRPDGRYGGVNDGMNLVNDPPLGPKVQTVWVNLYGNNGNPGAHRSRRNADESMEPGRVACVRVEVPEGRFDEEPPKSA